MPNYRIYLLDQDDRIFQAGTLIAVTDDEARRRARILPETASAIEVWQGTRCVGRTVSDPTRGAGIGTVSRGRRMWNESGDGEGYV